MKDKLSRRDEERRRDAETVRETPMTYDDYADLPDDGFRYELAGGRLEMMSPAPHPKHQLIIQELEDLLKSTCKSDYIVI